jgi:transcriptional regulator with XRE-family HTH domain
MIRLRIKEVAKAQGLNQSQLQIKAGVTPQLLNRYWNNHTQSVAFEPLYKIARALGVKPGDLIETTEDVPNEEHLFKDVA